MTAIAKVTDFQWKTMDGQILTLPEMKTSHIFNSMKMLFNHLAEVHGGEPVWFHKEYKDYIRKAMTPGDRDEMGLIVCVFITEIERRGDLPEQYREPYQQILHQIVGAQYLGEARKLLRETRLLQEGTV
jgi:hypothetical protein